MDYSKLKDDTYIGEKFNEFKKTEDYKNYTEMIKCDKPLLSPYLIEMAIFGYYYELLRDEMDEEMLKKYSSLITLAEENSYIKPEPIKEYKGVNVYVSEEDYFQRNPNVKPMAIASPFENLKNENEILN